MKQNIVSLKLCEFHKEQKQLRLASEYFGMPAKFQVRSHHTGKLVEFVPIQPGHPLFDEDQWDGEMSIYEPAYPIPNVKTLVIYNAY